LIAENEEFVFRKLPYTHIGNFYKKLAGLISPLDIILTIINH
jgi:hypothetical protein